MNGEDFTGHDNRECDEHRTVGPHRAYCFDCSEWCYPEVPCKGCHVPQLEARITELEAEIETLRKGNESWD